MITPYEIDRADFTAWLAARREEPTTYDMGRCDLCLLVTYLKQKTGDSNAFMQGISGVRIRGEIYTVPVWASHFQSGAMRLPNGGIREDKHFMTAATAYDLLQKVA